MSLIETSDVKNHPSPRICSKIHLCEPLSQPDATGFSAPETETTEADPSSFAEDFVAEHSEPDATAASSDHLPGSFHPEASAASKSAKA